jgi:membrane protease YdiL (CAAX protease family)
LYHASRGSAVEPWIAGAIVTATMASYLCVPLLVPPELALIAAQAVLAVVPVIGVAIARPARPLAALGLRGARLGTFVAAVLIGATAWYVNIRLASLLPLPRRQTRLLEELVERPSLAHALAAYALVPALCEEILFRGVLARALAHRFTLGAAAALSALAFSAYHLSVAQALPTLTLGFLLGLLAIRADSVAPAIAAHAINNALAIAMSRRELPAIAGAFDRHPTLALVGCAVATTAGIALVLGTGRFTGRPVS